MTDNKYECERCTKHFDRRDTTLTPDYRENRYVRLCFSCIDSIEAGANRSMSTTMNTPRMGATIVSSRVRLKEKVILKPHEIVKKLNKVVIGQDLVKKDVSVALFNHQKRAILGKGTSKSNVLLVGPTGCGKTHIIKNACEISELPFVIADATSLTEAGYVGKDVTSVLKELIARCKGDVSKAEKGVVYIDEFDKIARRKTIGGKDVSGEGTQQALLKMIEGAKITIEGKGMKTDTLIDTSKILFIFSGAFVGIEDIVSRRLGNKKSIGFEKSIDTKSTSNNLHKTVTTDDVISFGMIPELIGRIPLLSVVKDLTKSQLVEILTNCKGSITREYKDLFKLDDIKLTFSDKSIELISVEANKKKTGARSLNSLVERVMVDVVYHVQKTEKKPTKLMIQEKNVKKSLDI